MKNLLRNILVLAGIITIAASCQYKFIVEPVVPPPDPEDTISFSLDVEPIFQATEKNCVGCHKPGQTKPDLTTNNAYNSISSMGLTNTDDPESSIIYEEPLPTGNHDVRYTESQAAIVLQWIEQGAKNN